MLLDFIRGIVRPAVTLTGWLFVMALIWRLAAQLTQDAFEAIVFMFIGAMVTVIAYWFNDRSRRGTDGQ